MQQNYSDGQWRDTVDEAADNKVLTFPNVIVLYTDIHHLPRPRGQGPAVRGVRLGRHRLLLLRRQVREDLLAEGHPAGGPAPVLPDRGRPPAATPLLEVNTGKSYVAVTDVDFAGNFVHSTLDGVDLSHRHHPDLRAAATSRTTPRPATPSASSTDDLTDRPPPAAGEAEDSNTEDTTSRESDTEATSRAARPPPGSRPPAARSTSSLPPTAKSTPPESPTHSTETRCSPPRRRGSAVLF